MSTSPRLRGCVKGCWRGRLRNRVGHVSISGRQPGGCATEARGACVRPHRARRFRRGPARRRPYRVAGGSRAAKPRGGTCRFRCEHQSAQQPQPPALRAPKRAAAAATAQTRDHAPTTNLSGTGFVAVLGVSLGPRFHSGAVPSGHRADLWSAGIRHPQPRFCLMDPRTSIRGSSWLAMIQLCRLQLAVSRPWIMGYSFVSPPCQPGAARIFGLRGSVRQNLSPPARAEAHGHDWAPLRLASTRRLAGPQVVTGRANRVSEVAATRRQRRRLRTRPRDRTARIIPARNDSGGLCPGPPRGGARVIPSRGDGRRFGLGPRLWGAGITPTG